MVQQVPDKLQYQQQQMPNEFFSSFMNSDFPIDVNIPLRAVPQVQNYGMSMNQIVPTNSPLMQVAAHSSNSVSSPPDAQQQRGVKRKQNDADPKKEADLEARKQKRRVKNRQAAQLFRQRQKQHIADLEEKIKQITKNNSDLEAKYNIIAAENAVVREQLNYLRNFVVEALRPNIPKEKFAEMEAVLAVKIDSSK
eukprot:CAMPEP_0174250530 /NCGR_PEP_ID=MMETSP0439-20130205/678_1 /TAXON_ID=0 /ORGANISM="Stereomyxa ramosa, Strain Chinc5" /LENGTH=194 /DNA_ID=CAMNT_0015330631 /DNA_START=236 /DNA_END=820 /DNA_ORIENTATION=-